jgi:hypothetical protein
MLTSLPAYGPRGCGKMRLWILTTVSRPLQTWIVGPGKRPQCHKPLFFFFLLLPLATPTGDLAVVGEGDGCRPSVGQSDRALLRDNLVVVDAAVVRVAVRLHHPCLRRLAVSAGERCQHVPAAQSAIGDALKTSRFGAEGGEKKVFNIYFSQFCLSFGPGRGSSQLP